MQTKCVHDVNGPCGISCLFIFTLRLQDIHTWRITVILMVRKTRTPQLDPHTGIKIAQVLRSPVHICVEAPYFWCYLHVSTVFWMLILASLPICDHFHEIRSYILEGGQHNWTKCHIQDHLWHCIHSENMKHVNIIGQNVTFKIGFDIGIHSRNIKHLM